MELKLYLPVRDPINQNNLFGADSAYYQRVLGTNGHPGIDFECPMYTPILAACDGDAFYAYDKYHGDGLYVRTPNNGNPSANIIYWHMPDKSDTAHWVIPTGQGVVTPVKRGQLIGYTGNSGFPQESNGPHLHFAVMPTDPTGGALHPNNGFHGCIDPMPLLTNIFAGDADEIAKVVSTAAAVIPQVAASTLPLQVKLDFFSKVAQLLTTLLHVLELE